MKDDSALASPAAGGHCVLVADLGGTRLRAAVVDASGAVLCKEAIATPKDDPAALARVMRLVLQRAKGGVAGAVAGVPGPVDYSNGDVVKLPNLPGWEETVRASSLSAELGLPVLIANDADLAALGEHRYGAGRGSDDMLYVTSSTGVGAGVIIGGRLLHGRLSLAEAGHIIIDLSAGGTLEGMGSATALARAAGEDAASVAARAAKGDPDATQFFKRAANAFAVGVFNLVHCFSPQLVVIGGGMSQAGELLLGPVKRELETCGRACPASQARVVRADGGDDVGLRGGFAYWMDCEKDTARPSDAHKPGGE